MSGRDRSRRPEVVAFLGPSLPAAEGRRLGADLVLPPARQGDVWRALALRPRAIALVDGVFETTPSVWHHELLDALDAGVAVFGGASMGALRAAELSAHGMIGVGRIHDAYRRGALRGDDEVALLHGDAEAGYRPLTVPLVTVRALAAQAAAGRLVSGREGARLVAVAAELFYQERTWPRILAGAHLPPGPLARVRERLRRDPPDPKADDARATIRAAAAFAASLGPRVARAGARDGAPLPPPAPARRPSSLVRRRKLREGATVTPDAVLVSGAVLDALGGARDAATLRDDGLRHLLLASFARALGVRVTPDDRAAAAAALFSALRVARRRRAAFLAESGLDVADAARLVDDLAVERKLLEHARTAVPDGPSDEEGLALGSRLAGRWAEIARTWPRARAPRWTERRGRR